MQLTCEEPIMTAKKNRRKPTTGPTRTHVPAPGRSQPRRARAARPQAGRRRSRRAALAWPLALLAVAGLIAAAFLTTRSSSLQASEARPAPAFTLRTTAGSSVSLASYRGRAVVLYFNEGVGCDACFYQMRQLEQHQAELARAGITILPIVMNAASQVRPELAAFGIRTPYLIDTTGAVSSAYGALGKSMHAGLPGHGFVLIDARGTERWYGEYPSMYLSAAGLITQVRAHLTG
jgi:peroxiredoxin